MKLNAWNMSDGTVEIHAVGCNHRPNSRTRRTGHFQQDQVEFGKTDWASQYDFAHDYWDNGILEEHEAENGVGSFDVMQEMEFKPCVTIPVGGPAPAASEPTGKRSTNQELARWLVDLVAANAGERTPAEQQKLANWLHHLPTGGAAADRYWPEGFNRPSQSDWQR